MPKTIITEMPEPKVRVRLAPKLKMLKLVCPNCGKVFFRTESLARTVIACPACAARLTFNKEGKCALIKQVKYTREEGKKKLTVAGGVAAAAGARALWRRHQLKPIGKIATEVQKAVGVKNLRKVTPIPTVLAPFIGGHAGGKRIRIGTPRGVRLQRKWGAWVATQTAKLAPEAKKAIGTAKLYPGRRILAHEIAHLTPAALHIDKQMEEKTLRQIRGIGKKPKRIRRILKVTHGRVHGPVFKSTWRHVEKVMKRMGAMKKLRKLGYAREDPKHVRTYFTELKQHKVPFRTRMQWLSRIYGGRGGYTSEELYKIVTGKTVGGYYIFPFVKGAPPEVNRILERTYRTHREAGDTKVAAAIAAWTKVKQAGYVKVTKPAPVWTKRRYTMEQLKPIQVVDYGIGTGMGGLAERGVRGLFGAARRHPRITRGVGTFGVGYLTAKELAKRRKRKKGYALGLEHLTPDIPLNRVERLGKRLPTRKGITRVGKRIGSTASMAVKAALIGLAAKELLDLLSRRQPRAPWLPEIRSDIELSGPGYETLDQVVQYAGVMSSPLLKSISAKTGAALHKTKVGVERGLLMWLMGFISAELLSRGITTPKRRHSVTFPDSHQLYVRELRPGEQMPLPVWGYHPVKPREFRPHEVPRVSRRPIRPRLKKVAKIGAIPLAALLAIRLSKRGQEGYSFRSAIKKTAKITSRIGGGAGRVLRVASDVAIPALIVSELWPKKKRRVRPMHPPVQPMQPYVLGGLKRLLKLRKGKTVPMAGQRLRDLTLARKDPAMAELNKRLAAAAQKHKKHFSNQLNHYLYATKTGRDYIQSLLDSEVERYPFKSAAQRRWMHWKKPKMAKKWEEHTPEGADLPEKVSKHGLPLLTGRARLAAWGGVAGVAALAGKLGHRRKMKERTGKKKPMGAIGHLARVSLLGPATAPYYVGRGLAARKKMPEHVSKHLLGVPIITPLVIAAILAKKRKEKVSKHALSVPWALGRARDLMRLKGAKSQGREVVQWARKLAKTLRTAQLKTTDVKRKVELGARAGKWETVADQVGDVVGRGQLEKVGLLAAATAAGAAGHEIGKKRERKRVHRVVG